MMQEKKKLETVTFTHNGKRYYVRAKTKSEAIKKAALKEASLVASRIDPKRITVDEWWPVFIDTYHSNANEKTREDYESLYRRAIQPYIGQMLLNEVRQIDCQRICNYMSGKSLSYVRMVKILLTGIFQTAADNDYIVVSPCRNLRLPKAEAGERRALTDDERELFLQATDNLGQIGLYFKVLYYCGLRPSEGARIEGQDFQQDDNGFVLHVRGEKTKAAIRDVPVPSALAVALDLPRENGVVFLTQRGERPGETARRRWWLKVREEMEHISGRPVADDLTAYCLRHDFCTRMQEVGVDVGVARIIMGHAKISTTNAIYTHPNKPSLDKVRKLMDKAT